jgi:hypothetical protein
VKRWCIEEEVVQRLCRGCAEVVQSRCRAVAGCRVAEVQQGRCRYEGAEVLRKC